MKRIAFISLLCALGCLTGCDKREIMLYEERAGVYFSLNSQAYSFLENVGDTVHVVRVPVTVTGTASDKDRIVKAGLPDVDLNTTAEDDQYVIGDGLVKAGELSGFVDLTLYNDDRLSDSTYVVALELYPSEDFPEVRLNRRLFTVSFTNKLIQPENWGYLGLGTYSTAAYTFVLQQIAPLTYMPFWTGGANGTMNPDKEKYYWGYDVLGAYQQMIRDRLAEYNATHDEPLKHNDGQLKGEEITFK